MYKRSTVCVLYPALDKTDVNDAASLEQSPRKILFRYDCDSIPLYEKQEGCSHDYAERKACWETEAAISSPAYSTVRVDEMTSVIATTPVTMSRGSSWTENSNSVIDLSVTPDNNQRHLQLLHAKQKKRKYSVSGIIKK